MASGTSVQFYQSVADCVKKGAFIIMQTLDDGAVLQFTYDAYAPFKRRVTKKVTFSATAIPRPQNRNKSTDA